MKTEAIMQKLEEHGEALVRIETNLSNHLKHHESNENHNAWMIPLVCSLIVAFATILFEYLTR